jgi:hypothetical protein
MVAVLVVIGIVLGLVALWLMAIIVDRVVSRNLEAKWQETLEAHWAEWHEQTVEEDPLTPEVEEQLT